MLIEVQRVKSGKSKYICDRCKRELNSDNRRAIFVAKGSETKAKKWDLCERCYKALCIGIKKGEN